MAKAGKWIKRILLLVVLAIVAAVAYGFLHDKFTGPPPKSANLSDLRGLNTALHTYHKIYGHYPESLQELTVPDLGPTTEHAAGLLGGRLASGKAHGYRYTYAKTGNGYAVHADPEGADNNIHLFTDESSEIRFRRKQAAERNSDVLQ